MTLVLKERDIVGLVSMADAIEALRGPIRDQGAGEAMNLPRQISRTPNMALSVLQAAIPRLNVQGFKVYSVVQKDRFDLRYWVMLFGDDGALKAVMEAEELSRIRTGATAGIAADHLSRKDSRSVGILGTGWNATAQLEAVCAVRPIDTVHAWSPTLENLRKFCASQSERMGIEIRPAESAKAAVEQADIVITVTASKEPVLFGEYLKPGTHVNMVGAMKPDYREGSDSLIDRAGLIVADDRAQAQKEAGELIKAGAEGRLDWSSVRELSSIVAGRSKGREDAESVSIFKSLGIGLWDIAMAHRLYEAAKQKGIGADMPLEHDPTPLRKGAKFIPG